MSIPRRMAATEAGFQRAVIAFAELHGWAVYSVPDSRRVTAGGFPDLVLMHPTGPVSIIVAELKRAGQKPRPDQLAWGEAWERAGVPYYLWTPADWPEIERVLGSTADTPQCVSF